MWSDSIHIIKFSFMYPGFFECTNHISIEFRCFGKCYDMEKWLKPTSKEKQTAPSLITKLRSSHHRQHRRHHITKISAIIINLNCVINSFVFWVFLFLNRLFNIEEAARKRKAKEKRKEKTTINNVHWSITHILLITHVICMKCLYN